MAEDLSASDPKGCSSKFFFQLFEIDFIREYPIEIFFLEEDGAGFVSEHLNVVRSDIKDRHN